MMRLAQDEDELNLETKYVLHILLRTPSLLLEDIWSWLLAIIMQFLMRKISELEEESIFQAL